jgi:preprotein translocase subunit YajC
LSAAFLPLHPLLLQAPGGGTPQGCFDASVLVPMAGIFAVFYFLMIRPQQKQAQKQKEMLAALKKGDTVLTQAGMYGRVVTVGEKDVVLEIGAAGSGGTGTRVRFVKSQIAGVEGPAPDKADKSDKAADASPDKPEKS